MKAKIKMTYSVECFVEADNEDQLNEWMMTHTPEEADRLVRENGRCVEKNYNEEIICRVMEDSDVDFSIATE